MNFLMRTAFCLFSGIFCFLSCQTVDAQAVTAAELNLDKTPELTAAQKEFTNLPEQKRIDYFRHMQEAKRLFNQKRIFESFAEIHEARKIFDKNSDMFNLLGSCYVEFRDFENATQFYAKALALSPKSPIINFNIAELLFVSRKWEACKEKMNFVLTLLPKKDVVTRRIVELKIMLCHIALEQNEEANQMANKYDPLQDDSPFYYYAQAALCFRDKDMIKAEGYLQMANRVFGNPAIIAPWQDTMIEFGYISSFYGGADLLEEE